MMYKTLHLRRLVMVFTLVAFVGSSVAAFAGGTELRLRGRLMSPATIGDVSGKAEYRLKDGRRQFSIEIQGFQPGDVFDAMIAGAVIGTIVVDDFGIGDLNYDDNFEPGVDDPATLFPANFPALDGGELVQVGPLSGTLQRR